MDMRYSYPSSPYLVADPLGVGSLKPVNPFAPAPSRIGAVLERLAYRLLVLVVVVAGVAGVLFGLYRNDILLMAARRAGLESRYFELERRIGTPGWGTPRSVVLPGDTTAAAPAGAAAAAPATEPAEPAALAAKSPERPATDAPSTPSPAPASAPSPAGALEHASTPEGLPIVSLDSLPKLATKEATSEPAPVSLSAAPKAATTPATATRVIELDAPREVTKSPKPVAASKTSEAQRTLAAAPVAKREPPAAKPAAAPPPPVDDNPLKAAIRAAILKQKH